MNDIKIKRALISVSDKTGIVIIAALLRELGCEIISTGGTAKAITEHGIKVTDIKEVTGNPEAFSGRMKTISFKIESALLFDREKDAEEAAKLGIEPIDLVICNLYPFRQKLAENAELAELIENVDIGGPTMIRAAAKNYRWVTTITDPDDYGLLIKELKENQGAISEEFRFLMMRKAFNHTADYDAMIAMAMDAQAGESSLRLAFEQGKSLRYGENSHQKAEFYRQKGADNSLADLKYLHGKELSYNNIMDIEAAMRAVMDLDKQAVAVIKHSNPCGLAVSDNQLEALKSAWFGDPVSAFGSIIAFNSRLELATVEFLELDNKDKSQRKFIEVVVAPEFSPEAVEYLSFHKNLRIIQLNPSSLMGRADYRYVTGGLLKQDSDIKVLSKMEIVTQKKSTEILDEDLIMFGIRAVRNTKSNAIVIVQRTESGIMRLTGMGAGQPNRLISTQLALEKTRQNFFAEAEAGGMDPSAYYDQQIKNCLLISDAYFPFADNVEYAQEKGIRYIVQPGGSIRDKKVIKRANELGVTMIFTGMRHFRH